MTIKEFYVKTTPNGTPEIAVEIWYDSDNDTLPTNYAESSIAYCYTGTDKGKTKVFDGSTWVEQ